MQHRLPSELAPSLAQAARRGLEAVETEAAARLLEARLHGVALAKQKARQRQDHAVVLALAEAGQELMQSLEELLHDEHVWHELAEAEQSLERSDAATLVRMQEALDHDLLTVLPLLGYEPPPEAIEWATGVQLSLRELLDSEQEHDDLPGRRAVRARDELNWFVLRLRRVLVNGTRDFLSTEPVPSDRARSVRAAVATWVRRASLAAGPAALAAGLVAAGAGPQAGLAAGAVKGGWEAVKQVVQLGATDALTRTLDAPGLPESPDFEGDLDTFIGEQVARLGRVAGLPPGHKDRETAVFLVRRALYRGVIQEAQDGRWSTWRDECETGLQLLRQGDVEELVKYWTGG